MPDGRSGNYNGLVQGRSNADNVLADAYVKGLKGTINWTAEYEAMKKYAEVQHTMRTVMITRQQKEEVCFTIGSHWVTSPRIKALERSQGR